jgi:hypothetical protein
MLATTEHILEFIFTVEMIVNVGKHYINGMKLAAFFVKKRRLSSTRCLCGVNAVT